LFGTRIDHCGQTEVSDAARWRPFPQAGDKSLTSHGRAARSSSLSGSRTDTGAAIGFRECGALAAVPASGRQVANESRPRRQIIKFIWEQDWHWCGDWILRMRRAGGRSRSSVTR